MQAAAQTSSYTRPSLKLLRACRRQWRHACGPVRSDKASPTKRRGRGEERLPPSYLWPKVYRSRVPPALKNGPAALLRMESSAASGSGAASSTQVEQPTSVRNTRLREVAVRAVDESVACCSPDEFVEGFPGLSATHADVLQHVLHEAQHHLRENTMVSALRSRRNFDGVCFHEFPVHASALGLLL